MTGLEKAEGLFPGQIFFMINISAEESMFITIKKENDE